MPSLHCRHCCWVFSMFSCYSMKKREKRRKYTKESRVRREMSLAKSTRKWARFDSQHLKRFKSSVPKYHVLEPAPVTMALQPPTAPVARPGTSVPPVPVTTGTAISQPLTYSTCFHIKQRQSGFTSVSVSNCFGNEHTWSLYYWRHHCEIPVVSIFFITSERFSSIKPIRNLLFA